MFFRNTKLTDWPLLWLGTEKIYVLAEFSRMEVSAVHHAFVNYTRDMNGYLHICMLCQNIFRFVWRVVIAASNTSTTRWPITSVPIIFRILLHGYWYYIAGKSIIPTMITIIEFDPYHFDAEASAAGFRWRLNSYTGIESILVSRNARNITTVSVLYRTSSWYNSCSTMSLLITDVKSRICTHAIYLQVRDNHNDLFFDKISDHVNCIEAASSEVKIPPS